MYAMFENTLPIDYGKALVHTYQAILDTQNLYQELQDYVKLSTKVTMDAISLLSYITTSHLRNGN